MHRCIQGSALVSALLIMTIIASITATMAVRIRSSINLTNEIITKNKLYYAAELVKFWAIKQLQKNHKTKRSSLIINLPQKIKQYTLPIQISGMMFNLKDLQKVKKILHKKYLYDPYMVTNDAKNQYIICIIHARYMQFKLVNIVILQNYSHIVKLITNLVK